ncbi:carbohydrate ABC transporter permease [Brucella sp. BE17]|uniref:carbohydrate ABC transporter permease n=1 Tax=Brucella sp. BE17 TaxID=3142977 RepID=UPI0031BA7E5D
MTIDQRASWLQHGLALVIGLIMAVPILVAINTSLKTPAEVLDVLSLPGSATFANYAEAWRRLGATFANSLMITVPGVALSVLVGAIAAYPLAQIKGRLGFIIYMFLLTGMLVPYQIVQIPLFSLMRTLGLYNSIPGMWLVHVAYGVPICTFFMRNFFASVPRSMFEAAMLDGCGHAQYFYKVLLPASSSGLAALSVIQSRAIWNDLLFAMTLTNNDNARPVTVALNALTSGFQVQHGTLMAATIITIGPILLAYLLFQKAFVAGVLGGSSK